MGIPLPEVKILTRNCVDRFSQITASHGGTTSRLYDRDSRVTYKTVGAKRDTTTATLEIVFKVGTTETQFVISNLFILNTNVKHYTFLIWNGTAYETVHDGEVVAADCYVCMTFGPVLTSRVKLILYNTQNRYNQEKEIGQLIIARLRHTFDTGLTDYMPNYSEKKSAYEVADGGLQLAYTRGPGSRIARYGARATFTLLPRKDYDFLLCLKDEGEPFLWYPEARTRPDEVWYVHWVNQFDAHYTVTNVNAGYNLTLELREV